MTLECACCSPGLLPPIEGCFRLFLPLGVGAEVGWKGRVEGKGWREGRREARKVARREFSRQGREGREGKKGRP